MGQNLARYTYFNNYSILTKVESGSSLLDLIDLSVLTDKLVIKNSNMI